MKPNSSADRSMMPLVSLVIPVYNGSNFLREAIDSALAQTYENLEVIVVNDGSRDEGRTAAIAKAYGAKIRYYEKTNGGVASALNLAVKEMRGEYFSWLSHDDLYEPDKVEAQVAACRERGYLERVIVYSDLFSMDQTGKRISQTSYLTQYPRTQLEFPVFPLLNGLIHGCSLLISRDLLVEGGEFDETLRTTQDYDLWRRIFRRSRLVFVPRPLIHSRQHPDQGSHTIPSGRDEMEVLWSKIYLSVTPEERKQMYGSSAEYFTRALEFERKHLRLASVFKLLHQQRIEVSGERVKPAPLWRIVYLVRLTKSELRKLAKKCFVVLRRS